MKKIIYSMIMSLFLLFLASISSYAADEPNYVKNFDTNVDVLYANGTDIVIDVNEENQTVVKWNDKSIAISENTIVFGTGVGEQCETTSIIMNNGKVKSVVAGGWGNSKSEKDQVNNATVVINGGTINEGLYGGGFLYSEIQNSNVVVNGGYVARIYAGGAEAVTLHSITYDSGSESDLKGSGNRVNNANLTINNIEGLPDGYMEGRIYAGGDKYAYVGSTNLTINGGDLSKFIVTGAGEDGYVGHSEVEIAGGTIGTYRSFSKGLLEEINLEMFGGKVNNFYVGADKDETAKTKQMNKANVFLLGGDIETLQAGINNAVPLTIDKQNYNVYLTDFIEIQDNQIQAEELDKLQYELKLSTNNLVMKPNTTEQIVATITTNPEGYEDIFRSMLKWETNNPKVATVSDEGVVTSQFWGNAKITASILDTISTVDVKVTGMTESLLAFIIIILLIPVIITIITIYVYLRRR